MDLALVAAFFLLAGGGLLAFGGGFAVITSTCSIRSSIPTCATIIRRADAESVLCTMLWSVDTPAAELASLRRTFINGNGNRQFLCPLPAPLNYIFVFHSFGGAGSKPKYSP